MSANQDWPTHPHLYLRRRPVSTGLVMLGKLGYTVIEHICQITDNKLSWVRSEGSHVWNSRWWEECGIQWYDGLTFICFNRHLSLQVKPDMSVSNITQQAGPICHLVHHDYKSSWQIMPPWRHFTSLTPNPMLLCINTWKRYWWSCTRHVVLIPFGNLLS